MRHHRFTVPAFLLMTLLLTLYVNTSTKRQSHDEEDAHDAHLLHHRPEEANNGDDVTIRGARFKKIVAYSMLKSIELEGGFIKCPTTLMSHAKQRRPAEVEVRNNEWTQLPDTTFWVYSVHFDGRLSPFNYLRVLGMAQGNFKHRLFCTTFNGKKTVSTVAIIKEIWSFNWLDPKRDTNFNVFLVSCKIPQSNSYKFVALSRNPCNQTNIIFKYKHRVARQRKTKQIVLCVKPLHFSIDITWKLMQWITMSQILGADQINIYIDHVQGRTRQFLFEFYPSAFLRPIVYSPMGDRSDVWQRRKNEILVYNDCLYSNLDARFVLPLDIDELPIPKLDFDWKQLIQRFPPNYASFSIRNAYFFTVTSDVIADVEGEKDSEEAKNMKSARKSDEKNEAEEGNEKKKWKEKVGSRGKEELTEEDEGMEKEAGKEKEEWETKEEWEEKEERKEEEELKEVVYFGNYERSRLNGPPEESCKSFVATGSALTVFNHYALDVLRPGVRRNYFVPSDQAQLNHYRRNCSLDLLPQCLLYYSSRKTNDRLVDKYKTVFASVYSDARHKFLVNCARQRCN